MTLSPDPTLVAEDDGGSETEETWSEQDALYDERLTDKDIVCPATDEFRFGAHGDGPLKVYETLNEAWKNARRDMAPHLIPSPGDFELAWLVPDEAAQLIYQWPLSSKLGVLANAIWTTSAMGEGPGWFVGSINGCSSLERPVVEKNLGPEDAEGSPEPLD